MSLLWTALDRVKALELPLRRHLLPNMFHRVEIETSSRCNRRCSYCPVSYAPRPDHLMDEDLFVSILDQLREMGFAGRLSPHFYGEPLLDPRLPRLVREARRRLPRARIVVYTNGDPLTPERARDLLDAGVDLFLVTFEAGESAAFRRVRRELPPLTVRRRFLVRHFHRDVPRPFNRGGAVRLGGREMRQKACILPAAMVVIDAWGRVKLCANDYFGTADLGDLTRERLRDVWWRPENVRLRRELLRGRFDRPVCRRCVGLEPAPASGGA